MEREFTCFFTGHRIISRAKVPEIERRIRCEVSSLIEDKGVIDFITGGALGFDTIAAKTIIALKEKYDYIKLHLYLPCHDQMANWNSKDQFTGRMIMSYADSKTYVIDGKYVTGCMQLRNKKMAKDAMYCIAYMTNLHSGTAQTVEYAENAGGTVINIAYNE